MRLYRVLLLKIVLARLQILGKVSDLFVPDSLEELDGFDAELSPMVVAEYFLETQREIEMSLPGALWMEIDTAGGLSFMNCLVRILLTDCGEKL